MGKPLCRPSANAARLAGPFRLPTVLERGVEKNLPGSLRAWHMPRPLKGQCETVYPFLSTARTCEAVHSLRASVRRSHGVFRPGLREVVWQDPGWFRGTVGCL